MKNSHELESLSRQLDRTEATLEIKARHAELRISKVKNYKNIVSEIMTSSEEVIESPTITALIDQIKAKLELLEIL